MGGSGSGSRRLGRVRILSNEAATLIVESPLNGRRYGISVNNPETEEVNVQEITEGNPFYCEDDVDHVEEALENPIWDFRTVHGIAEDTHLPPLTVMVILDQEPVGRVSPLKGKNGETLYRPVGRRNSIKEHLESIRLVVAN